MYKESYFVIEFLRSFSNYLNPFYPRLSAAFGSIAKFFVGAQNLIACTARVWRGVRVRIARARPFRTLLWHLVRRLSFSTNPPTHPTLGTAHCIKVRFFKTFMVKHGMANGGRFCIILVLDINHCEVKMFLKPVWVGKIHGVGVYATHSVRIWWFRNKFSLFQLKRM